MKHRSIYVYPWDVTSNKTRDVDKFCAWTKQSHLTAITVATSYHAGKFIRPAPETGPRVIFPEDGTIYFQPDLNMYGAVKPKVSEFTSSHDVLRDLCNTPDLDVFGWTILLHNTRLGFEHPDKVVRNAFGDPYPYSLCPSHPDVRTYAISLSADVSQHYPVSGLSIETPGFLPFAHGYHHEFAQVQSNQWLNHMLGLCFCRHCMQGAEHMGIDAMQLRNAISSATDDYLQSSNYMNTDEAAQRLETDVAEIDDLAGYIRYRCNTVTSLVGDIKAAMRPDCSLFIIPTTDRPTKSCWIEGSDLVALANTADGLEIPFYEPNPARVLNDAAEVRQMLGNTARIRGIIRPGNPDLDNQQDLIDAAVGLDDADIEGISFYNYGLLRPHHRRAIGEAAKAASQLPTKES